MALEKVIEPNIFDYLKLASLGAIWGIAFHLINITLDYLSPLQIALLRVILGGVTVAIVILLGRRGRYWPTHKQWALIILSSFLSSTLPYYLINWGSQTVSGSEASLLIGAGPFISLILSHYLTEDEHFNYLRFIAVFFGFLGLIAIFIPELRSSSEFGAYALEGKVMIILAAFCYAAGAIVGRYISQLPTMMTVFYLMLVSALVLLPFGVQSTWPVFSQIPLKITMAIIFLGVIATGLAINIRLNILRRNGAVFMSQVVYLIPIFGVFWGIVLFKDEANWYLFVSLFCVVLGLFFMKKASGQS